MSIMKTKLFIDFDGTLIDTKLLKIKLFQVLEKAGFKLSYIQNQYQPVKDSKHFDSDFFINQVARKSKISKKKRDQLIKQFDSELKKTSKYLFRDTVNFLEALDHTKYEVILFTLGSERFQSKKVVNSGTTHLFDRIIYTEQEKWLELDHLVTKDEQFITIDDRIDALKKIKAKFPKALVVGISRYEKSSSNLIGLPIFNGLDQINNYLTALINHFMSS